MGKDEDDGRGKDDSWAYPKKEDKKLIGSALIFGLMGAAITTFAVTHMKSILDGFYTQWSRCQVSFKNNSSSWSSFQEEARRRYHRRLQEELEEEIERVERIRRMQSVFNRERNKFKRSYDSWQQYGPGEFHEHFQRNDWYWKSDTSSGDHGSNFGDTTRTARSSSLSHHYSVLGLDRLRTKPYTDAEIKSAFRAKAKEFHPDQNQDNKESAEAKFKEVMRSYEAIKSERKKDGLR